MLTLNWGSASDVGRVRDANEDSWIAEPSLFAVADGMGGHAAGEVASALAIAELAELADEDSLDSASVIDAIDRANERIVDASLRRRDRYGMGTTLTGVAVVSEGGRQQWAVFNVGDSRVYRFARGSLEQVTVDHSEVQELISAGRIDRAAARTHPRRNVVTRSLGSRPAPIADLWVLTPAAGDRLLVCSDGLTNELTDGSIAQVLESVPDAQDAAAELVRLANEAGGHDNVTVIVIDARDGDAAARAQSAMPSSASTASRTIAGDASSAES